MRRIALALMLALVPIGARATDSPGFRAAGTASTATSGNLSNIALPTGHAAGDFLLAACTVRATGTASMNQSYNTLFDADFQTTAHYSLYYKWDTGSETAPTWTNSASAAKICRIYAFTGIEAVIEADGIDTMTSSVTSSTSSPLSVTASGNTTVSNDMSVACYSVPHRTNGTTSATVGGSASTIAGSVTSAGTSTNRIQQVCAYSTGATFDTNVAASVATSNSTPRPAGVVLRLRPRSTYVDPITVGTVSLDYTQTDTYSCTGCISLDTTAHPSGAAVYTDSSYAVTSQIKSPSFSTGGSGRMLVAAVAWEANAQTMNPITISDTASLSWTKAREDTWTSGSAANMAYTQIWEAWAASTLSNTTVTVTRTNTTDQSAGRLSIYALVGAAQTQTGAAANGKSQADTTSISIDATLSTTNAKSWVLFSAMTDGPANALTANASSTFLPSSPYNDATLGSYATGYLTNPTLGSVTVGATQSNTYSLISAVEVLPATGGGGSTFNDTTSDSITPNYTSTDVASFAPTMGTSITLDYVLSPAFIGSDAISDAVTLGESMSGGLQASYSISDAVTLDQILSATFIGSASVSDAVTPGFTETETASFTATFSSTMDLVSTFDPAHVSTNSISDAVTPGHANAASYTGMDTTAQAITLDYILSPSFIGVDVTSDAVTLGFTETDTYFGSGTTYDDSFTEPASLGATVAQSVTWTIPAAAVSDDFNRANGPLGSNWEAMTDVDANLPVIASNRAIVYDAETARGMHWVGADPGDSYIVQATFTSAEYPGYYIVLRRSGSSNALHATVSTSSGFPPYGTPAAVRFYKNNTTQVAHCPIPFPFLWTGSGDTLKVKVLSSGARYAAWAYVNSQWIKVCAGTDTGIGGSPYVGLILASPYTGDVTADDFSITPVLVDDVMADFTQTVNLTAIDTISDSATLLDTLLAGLDVSYSISDLVTPSFVTTDVWTPYGGTVYNDSFVEYLGSIIYRGSATQGGTLREGGTLR